MNLGELIRRFRTLSNDRVAHPYFWGDTDLKDWFNDAQRQAAIRARLLPEDSIATMCRIPLQAGKHTYKLNPKVYEIIMLRLLPGNGGRPEPMALKSREWLDANRPDWRDDVNPPRFAIQSDIALRVVGAVAAGDVLDLEVYRLPLKDLCSEGDVPEIRSEERRVGKEC